MHGSNPERLRALLVPDAPIVYAPGRAVKAKAPARRGGFVSDLLYSKVLSNGGLLPMMSLGLVSQVSLSIWYSVWATSRLM